MKIALLQIKQNRLYDFDSSEYINPLERRKLAKEIVSRTADFAQEAAARNCDYIITPEAVNFTGVPLDEETFGIVEPFGGESFERFSEIASKYSVNILSGLYNMREGKVYNSAVLFGRSGRIESVYDKVNLAGDENKMITSGSKYIVIESEFGKIAPLICWDMQCGAADAVAKMGADIIFCSTWGWENDYGIGCAADNGVYVAAAMGIPYRGGIEGMRTPSEILDRRGSVIAVSGRFKEEILVKEIKL